MKGGSDDTSKCTVQAKHGRNGKVVFANLPRLGYSLAYRWTLLRNVIEKNRKAQGGGPQPFLHLVNGF